MLKERLITAAVLIAVLLVCYILGRYALFALALCVYGAINFEYFNFAAPISKRQAELHTFLSFLLPLGYLFNGLAGVVGALLCWLIISWSVLVFQIEYSEHQLLNEKISPALITGVAYTGFLGVFIPICALDIPGPFLLWLVAVVVACDSFAYFGGRFFGVRLLAPRISPKKTIVGAFSGLIGAAVVGALLTEPLGVFPFWIGVLLSVFLAVAAQLGDMAESLLKRIYGIKDSGILLRGHGGVLDRVDALMFAAPLFFFLMTILGRTLF